MANQSIFVTDDDETYIEMVRNVLVDVGYRNVTWHVGKEAFNRICDQQPDLVLLDINMTNPGKGWSTLDILKLHPRTAHIPIILSSTEPHLPEHKMEMLAELQVSFLEKPFHLETLLDKVAAVMGLPQA
jgi:CheY-like chemotaxis protein